MTSPLAVSYAQLGSSEDGSAIFPSIRVPGFFALAEEVPPVLGAEAGWVAPVAGTLPAAEVEPAEGVGAAPPAPVVGAVVAAGVGVEPPLHAAKVMATMINAEKIRRF